LFYHLATPSRFNRGAAIHVVNSEPEQFAC
jgi:hypothetical protein